MLAVDESPLRSLLAAMDKLDVEATMALCGSECRFLAVDGRHAEGHEAVRQLVSDFLSQLRSTTHEITSQWHQDDVWIAEVTASYELMNWLRMEGLPRAIIIRVAADGIRDIRAYGAGERQLIEHTEEEPTRVGGRTFLPL